jgi:hypothetical protein
MKKYIAWLVIVLFALASFPLTAFASDYDQRFSEVFGGGSYTSYGVDTRSPIRSGGSDVWAR